MSFRALIKSFLGKLRRETTLSFPLEYKRCPNCGCKTTVVEQAYIQEPGSDLKKHAALEAKAAVLRDPVQLSGITAPAVLCFMDICAKCGLYRCYRVEKQNIPLQVPQPMGFMGGQTGAHPQPVRFAFKK